MKNSDIPLLGPSKSLPLTMSPGSLFFLLLFLFSFSFLGHSTHSMASMRNLTFEEFKQSCSRPEEFHSQMPPQSIKFFCEDTRQLWLPKQTEPLQLPNKRTLKMSILSDKYEMKERTESVPHQNTSGSCTLYHEVTQRIRIQRPLTCEDLTGFNGNLVEYCQNVIEQNFSEEGELFEEVPTGRVYSTCNGKLLEKPKAQNDETRVSSSSSSASSRSSDLQSGSQGQALKLERQLLQKQKKRKTSPLYARNWNRPRTYHQWPFMVKLWPNGSFRIYRVKGWRMNWDGTITYYYRKIAERFY